MTESAQPDRSRSSVPPPLVRARSERVAVPVRAKLLPLWVALAVASALLLALSALGLVPAREPARPVPVAFDPQKTLDPVRLPERNASTQRVHRLPVWSFPVCARPKQGARLVRLSLRPERDSFLVWCQGEYLLFDVEAQQELPRVTRLGRFSVRGELPGGAAVLDLDYDGVLDLVLGVAPAPGLVHRPFSGAFWLRGRAQGGFELPRTLVEMPVVDMAAVELDDAPGSELVVLTRGDTAAQRAGDLWLFAGGTSPARVAVVPTALAPSDLTPGGARDGQTDLWVSSTQPGSLVRLRFSRTRADWARPERSELPARSVQGFVDGPRDEHTLYVRDASSVASLEGDKTPVLKPWLSEVEVGPSAWLRTSGDAKPALFGATQSGLAWFHGTSRIDRALPTGTRVVEASSTSAGARDQRAVLLLESAEQEGQLALAFLPIDVRSEATELELRSGAVEAAPTEAKVALE